MPLFFLPNIGFVHLAARPLTNNVQQWRANYKAVFSKASLELFISIYTMQWLSLGWSYLSSSGQDLLTPKPAAYTLQVIVCERKIFAVTTRETNHTLCICFVLVFFLCVYIAMVLDSSCAWILHICLLALYFC